MATLTIQLRQAKRREDTKRAIHAAKYSGDQGSIEAGTQKPLLSPRGDIVEPDLNSLHWTVREEEEKTEERKKIVTPRNMGQDHGEKTNEARQTQQAGKIRGGEKSSEYSIETRSCFRSLPDARRKLFAVLF